MFHYLAQATGIANDATQSSDHGLPDIANYQQQVMDWLENNWAEGVTALVIIFLTLLLSSWLGRFTANICRRARIEETLSRFFGKMVRWAVLAMGILAILGKFGVETSSFAVVIGSIGLAIGLALQGSLSNIASGVMLLIFRPFKVDDYIVVAGEEGIVEEIDLFTTGLNTLDNRHIIIPNGTIFGSVIKNFTHNKYRRVDVKVGIAYNECLRETRAVLESATKNIPNVIYDQEDKKPYAYLVELADSALNWQVRVWCKNQDYWQVRENVTVSVKEHLVNANVSIPFPQLDVHLQQEAKSE